MRERERERETSFCVPFSEGNQCMRTPRFMTAGISLNKSGVVTCKSSLIWLKLKTIGMKETMDQTLIETYQTESRCP
jgi:hypothetical protein